jgi:hypothetical protein
MKPKGVARGLSATRPFDAYSLPILANLFSLTQRQGELERHRTHRLPYPRCGSMILAYRCVIRKSYAPLLRSQPLAAA